MNQTVDFVNASDFFEAIELGGFESQEFLDQFTYGDSLTEFTFGLLGGIKHVNIEG